MVGAYTIEKKWTLTFPLPHSYLTPAYLSDLFPFVKHDSEALFINGAALPNPELIRAISELNHDDFIHCEKVPIAFKAFKNQISDLGGLNDLLDKRRGHEVQVSTLKFPEDILNYAHHEFLKDVDYLSKENNLSSLDASTRIRGKNLIVTGNVIANDAIINTMDGPVVLEDGAEIMEGAVLKGPVYIGKGSKVHVGAKVYAGTMLGPHCRIGGEIKRTTIFGYSNKAHDGFLGDSILAKWCNLGADTNNSNLKNTYGNVSLWDYDKEAYRVTNRQFLGMILGDHTMAGINTSFMTGSTTGIFCSIYDGRPDRNIKSYSWGKTQRYQVDKALHVAKTVMARRNIEMSTEYEKVVRYLEGQ